MNSNQAQIGRAGVLARAAMLAFLTLTVCALASAATVPAMLPTSVTAGAIDPAGKVPTINGVPGSQVTNLDVAFPLSLLAQGNQYVYAITVEDNNYSGSCTVSYALTQIQNGKKVTLDSKLITKFNTAPGNIWLWVAEGKPIPNSPGLATLEGIFKCGTNKNTISATVLLQ